MENFKSFITEQKNEDYKIVVLSVEHSDKSITSKRIKEEADKMGLLSYIIGINGSRIEFNNGVYTIHELDDEKGFEISSDNTVVFIRGTPSKDSSLDIISELEKIGVCVVNSRTTISTAADKYRTYIRLKDYGLTQPKTELIPNAESLEFSVKNLDTKFPIILKTLRGSKGVGVLFIESERALTSIVQLIYKTDFNADLLIQEYIKTDFDIRVIVLGGKIIGTMQREIIEGDFRSNVSQGAKIKKYSLTELEIEHSLLAAKALDGMLTAVDFIPSSNPKSIPPYILEVNSSPGTEGIEEANKKNIVKEILTHFKNPDVRNKVPLQCGYEEVVSVNPFGEMIAKFDTGNSVLSVLHAENINIKGKKITFTLNGKTITTNLQKTYEVDTGGGEDERPVVKLEMEFSGTVYKDVMFGLNDRSEMGTDVLLNRFTMNRLNVMVNPQRKFVVTTQYTLDK
jgi:RimK family alpha-L-glutamate ligase|tara:strand:+ start:111 stop:1475 length:1365 start_codon:yes stop_codon:yes gene_type:complete